MRLGYANVTATIALAVALSGTAYAAGTITSANIKDNSVKSRDIRNGGIKSKDLAETARSEIRGPAGQIFTTRPPDVVLQGKKTVLKLDLPAGAWSVVAHVGGVHNGIVLPTWMECLLGQGTTELDFAKLFLETATGDEPLVYADMSLNGAVALAAPGSVTVTCTDPNGGGITLTGLAMTATRGQSVTVQ